MIRKAKETTDMFFTDEADVIRLAGEFYGSRLPAWKWDKATQLTVTLYYAIRFPYRMAFELIRDRVLNVGLGRYCTPEQRSDLESSIHRWLRAARSFAVKYRNIDDLSSLANIFITVNWHADEPYPHGLDLGVFEADTARLDGAAAGLTV
jgi:hypothetical protein